MIPLIIAAIGGYFIGDGSSAADKFAKGGAVKEMTKDEYKALCEKYELYEDKSKEEKEELDKEIKEIGDKINEYEHKDSFAKGGDLQEGISVKYNLKQDPTHESYFKSEGVFTSAPEIYIEDLPKDSGKRELSIFVNGVKWQNAKVMYDGIGDYYLSVFQTDQTITDKIKRYTKDINKLKNELSKALIGIAYSVWGTKESLTVKIPKPVYAEGGETESKKICHVREDILDEGDTVSVGDTYVGAGNFEYRWTGEDEDNFQIKLDDKWLDAESSDFEFDDISVSDEGSSDSGDELIIDEDAMVADVLYTDGANFKQHYVFLIPKNEACMALKEGDEIDISAFNVSEDDWKENLLPGEYDPDFDHTIVEVITIRKIKPDDVICNLQFAKGGEVKYWIKDAIKHKGALRKTAKKEGLIKGKEKLSMTDLKKLEKEGGKTSKRAHLAETLKKIKK